MDKLAFISYSRRDAEFAISLDAALRAAGVRTFRDERDIRVGDSFPERIYAGISSASHLIHIVSKESASSRWVAEELDAAKVRQLEGSGFKILPAVIDDTELPVNLKHIHFADFRRWRDPYEYRKGIGDLLRAMDVDFLTVDSALVAWWLATYSKIKTSRARISHSFGILDVYCGGPQWFDLNPYGQDDWLIKSFQESAWLEAANDLLETINSSTIYDKRLEQIKKACNDLQTNWKEVSRHHDARQNFSHLNSMRASLITIESLLSDLETEVTTVLFSVMDHG
ncbi:toll/interleukin-1 receptor domain-containing protein [Streptomyces chartreusis]